jgi:hypothetical protein
MELLSVLAFSAEFTPQQNFETTQKLAIVSSICSAKTTFNIWKVYTPV